MYAVALYSFCLASLSAYAQVSENRFKDIEEMAAMEKRGHTRLRGAQTLSMASGNFDVKYYRCEWEVDPAVRYIKGKVTVYYTIVSATSTISFDLVSPLVADSVKQRNQTLVKSQANNGLVINFPSTASVGVFDSVSIFYQGVPANASSGSFVQSTHSGTPVIWTLSEPYGSSDWWPCKNGLDDKADSLDVYVTNPIAYKAASNGVLQSQVTSENGTKTTAYWKHRYPIASYLVCFAVTNYAVFNNSVQLTNGLLPMQTYCYPESQTSFQNGTINTLNAMKLFDSTFGPYPFMNEKYGHVQFGWGGGMEHQTSSFVVNIGESLCAHELGHQWFGDKITCGSWKDIWLNEGFATHLASMYMESKYPANIISTRKSEINTITSQAGGSVEVSDTTNVDRIFDSRLSYTKGSHLLYMLRWILGETVFFNALRNYQTDPAVVYGFARTADLKRHLEQTSGRNLTNFFNQWYSGQGYPSYNVQWSNAGSGNVWIRMNQTTSHSSVPFFELPVALQFKNATQSVTVVVNNTSNGEVFIQPIGFVADTVIIDPEVWLITRNNTSAKLPTCGTVTGLASTAITTTTATVSWTATSGANNYEVDYKLASSSTWINAATATTSLSINLSGLTAASLYDWRVKPNCSAPTGTYSQAQFTSASIPTCGTVTGLTSSSITSSGATLNWSALSGANNYTVDYKLASSGTWIRAATSIASLSTSLSGLAAGSLYDWRVNANCTGATGPFAQAQFTTASAVTCPGPYDVSTNGTTGGAAIIPLNTDVKGTISPVNDLDYYRFHISTGGTITLTLQTLPANYNLDLYNTTGKRLGRSNKNGTNNESISATVATGDYYAQVYPSGSANSATLCYNLKVATGTANRNSLIISESDAPMTLFPNPADQVLNVYMKGYNKEKMVEVFDMKGRKMMSRKVSQEMVAIPVSRLAPGLYVISITTNDGKVLSRGKFVKQ